MGWTEIAATFHDCDDDQALRILLVDNRANDLATYDDTALADLLQQIAATDLGLDGTLYDGDALDQLIHDLGREDEIGVDAPETAPAITQLGDIWLLGEHRLMCGDSLDIANLDRLMNGRQAGCVLTDPPYGINLDTDYTKLETSSKKTLLKGVGANKYKPVSGDDRPFDASDIYTFYADTKEQFWFGADYYRRTLPDDDLAGSWLVWDKRTESSDAGFGSGFELIWSRNRHKRTLLRFFFFAAFGVEARNRYHPTQKPTPLLKEIITRWTDEKAIIADPFAGSGSTLIAAHITGRICYTMELDPQYCDIIGARYQKQTGDLPRLEATGETHNFIPDAD